MKRIQQATLIIILIGATGTTVLGGMASRWTLPALLFQIYILLPYVVLFLLHRKKYEIQTEKSSRVALLIAALGTTIFNLMAYFDVVFLSTSSTAALAFVFVPFYSFVFIPIAYFLAKWISRNIA